jgi:hypothetical protein
VDGEGDRVVTLLRRLWLAGGQSTLNPASVDCMTFAVGRRTLWDDLVGLSFSESIALCGRLLWRVCWLMASVIWYFLRVLKVFGSIQDA